MKIITLEKPQLIRQLKNANDFVVIAQNDFRCVSDELIEEVMRSE